MKIEIVFYNPRKKVTRYASDINDINEKVYDTLTRNGISEELAIDCANWAELAIHGESYNEETFDVYISEEVDA